MYVPMDILLTHTLALIGFLPAGYVGNGYPLPSLNRDAQSQTAKRKELTNNQTKTPNGVITFTFPLGNRY